MATVAVEPALINWAVERSGINFEKIIEDFPQVYHWGKEEVRPTIRQLEKFANKTRTPLGYLFLLQPPDESLPIPNFRTLRNEAINRPSPDLIETIQQMQLRQDWMRDFLIEEGENKLGFVNSVNINTDVKYVVKKIREMLNLNEDWALQYSYWKEALSGLYKAVDHSGILIMKNGVVGNNTHRKLKIDEFRGFVLIDEYAPLIFVNGSDYETAQMFTIAHELAHVFIGKGAIFNLQELQPYDNEEEKFCNSVAAEFLVPESKLQELWGEYMTSQNPFKIIAGKFKVSQIVIARRALDLKFIDLNRFLYFYNQYKDEQEEAIKKKKEKEESGGNFYNTQNTRIGRRFASAVIVATKEGRLSYKDAFNLTGLRGKTFNEYSNRLGIK